MKAQKSLFLNDEVLRIEQANGKTRFLKVSSDGAGMQEVSYAEFMDFFKSLAYVFATSWNTKLIEEYREFDKFIQSL